MLPISLWVFLTLGSYGSNQIACRLLEALVNIFMKLTKYRDSSGRLAVAIDDMPSLAYRFVRWRLCKEFSLNKAGDYKRGLDSKFQDFSGAEGKVSIEWDNWSGFSVVALDSESEPLVDDIRCWLKGRYS